MLKNKLNIVTFYKDGDYGISNLISSYFPFSRVFVCNSFAQVKNCMRSEESIDLLISDAYEEIRVSGLDFLQHNGNIAAVFCTSDDSLPLAVEFMKMGASDYILIDGEKKFEKKLLYSILEVIQSKSDFTTLARDLLRVKVPVVLFNSALEILFSNAYYSDFARKDEIELKEMIAGSVRSERNFRKFLRNKSYVYYKIKKKEADYNNLLLIKFSYHNKLLIIALFLKDSEMLSPSSGGISLKKSLFASIVHELRSPLNSILGFTSLLSDGEKDKEKQKRLGIIKNSSKYLLNLVNDILDYSKMSSGKVRLHKMNFMLNNTLDHIYQSFVVQALDKDINFQLKCSSKIPTVVNGDELRFSQVLINILSNSFKFTDCKGDIVIDCLYREGSLVVKISDSGIGIPPEKLDTIFIPFEQAGSDISKKYGGTGLGLTITKNLVEAMGGSISVWSEVGKGTEFTLSIPLEKVDISGIDKEEILSIEPAIDRDRTVDDSEKMVERWITKIGKEKRLIQLSLQALRKLPKRMEELYNRIESGDHEEIKGMVHKLKGFTGSYGMDEIYNIMVEIDGVVKADVLELAKVKEMLKEVNKIINRIPHKYFEEGEGEDIVEDAHKEYSQLRILIADDSPENLMLLKAYLNQLDYRCETVKNGQEAIDKIKVNDYDILFLDMQMPVLNGLETMELLNSEYKDKKIFVIAITADSTAMTREKILEAGADHFMTKPIEQRVLKEVLNYYKTLHE